jgi:hypothetical protein
MPRVEGDFYVSEADEALTERLDRFVTLARAIEARGLGHPRVLTIARCWAARAPSEPWYRVLGKAQDIHETRKVARAVAEWSDSAGLWDTGHQRRVSSKRWGKSTR